MQTVAKITATSSESFRIGRAGFTFHQGSVDPSSATIGARGGDLYIETSATPQIYQYDGARWLNLSQGGTGSLMIGSIDKFTGNGVTGTFTLSRMATEFSSLVVIDGMIGRYGIDYSYTGTSLQMTSPPYQGQSVYVYHLDMGTNTPANGWMAITSSISTSVNSKYLIDTTSGPVTVTLPANPQFGDEIRFIDGAGMFGTNPMTIIRNGQKIQGRASDVLCNSDEMAFGFVYFNATHGWRLIENPTFTLTFIE